MSDGKVVIETGLDASGIENGLKRISGICTTGLKATTAVISGVSAALLGAGGYAIKVGSDFESAMSKVEAISGATEAQVNQLTEMAKKMGATTKFSATESAEAFQYMAMAGWKMADMLDGIEGIMNLAAASGEDLATTSDIVTDALTAFGMAASDSAHFSDVLAAASSNANTDVAMLGESFKYVAPVAGAMNYSVEDVSKALGLMANASVKGSMAGTSLKTALSNLAAPTKNMREAMNKYGISLTDSEGNMKSLDGVMQNLRESLGDLSEQEQTAAASAIFGKEAMSGMLAIVNASEADYKKLSDAMASADGTAKKMADTMNDNLQGKIVLAKSAIEGLGIQFYETVQDDMKGAVEEGITYINQLSDAFANGGLEAAINKTGDIIASLTTRVAQSAPEMVDASADLIQAFIKGIVKNRKQLKHASNEIVDTLCDGLVKLLPKKIQEPAKKAMSSLERTFKTGTKNVLNVSKTTLNVLCKLFEKLADNMDTVLPVTASIVAGFKTFRTVSGPVQTAVSVFVKLKTVSSETGLAMGALNAVMKANPAVLIASGIAVLVAGLAAYITTTNRADEQQDAFNKKIDELGASIEKTQNELDGLTDSMKNTSPSINNSTVPIDKLRSKLDEAFDSTGKVKDGCEDMANYILSQLNDAMGTEYSITADGFIQNNEGIKQSLKTVKDTIDEYVQKLKQKSLQEAVSSQYTEALQLEGEAVSDLTDAQKSYNDALEKYSEAVKTYMETNDMKGLKTARDNLEKTQEKLTDSSKAAVEAKGKVEGLDSVMDKLAEGTPESVQEALNMYAQIPVEAQNAADGVVASQSAIQAALSSTDYVKATEGFRLAVLQIEESGGKIPESLRDSITEALNEFERMGPEGQEKMAIVMGKMMDGMSDQIPQFKDAAYKSSDEIISAFREYLISSGAMEGTGKETASSFAEGITQEEEKAANAGRNVVQTTASAVTQKSAEKKTEIATASASMTNAISEGAATVDTSSMAMQKAQEAVDGTTNALNSGASQVQSAAAAVGNAAQSGLASSNMVGSFGRQGINAVAQVSGSISKNTGSVSSASSALGKASANALKGVNLGGNFQQQAKNSVTQFSSAIRSSTANAVSTTRTLGTSSVRALTACNLPSSGRTHGLGFSNSFSSGIRSGNSGASGAAGSLGNSARSALNSYRNSGYSIGLNFSSSFASGIRAGGYGVASAAAAVANAAASAAKANLQIHSPSRVGGYIGRMFDKGIELDVKKGSGGIEKAVKEVTDIMKINPSSLLSSMRGAFVSNINRIASDMVIRANGSYGESNKNGSYPDTNLMNRIVDRLAERFAEEMENVTIQVKDREFGRLVKSVT